MQPVKTNTSALTYCQESLFDTNPKDTKIPKSKLSKIYNVETIYNENPCDFSSGIAALAD
jgi:hypothetical protein